jgi:pimeloyl-ACP methyl ester carboxylesterase
MTQPAPDGPWTLARTLDVPLPDGRTLHVRDDGEPGDPRGPLVLHHGTPQAGLVPAVQLDDARRQGLRCISFDRAGYGGSPRHEGRRVADVAADVAAMVDALGVDRFVTVGASGGGPHALACAALLPDRVVAAATVAGVAPYGADGLDWLAGMGDDNVAEFTAAAAGAQQLGAFLTAARQEMLEVDTATLLDVMATLLPPADLAVLTGELGAWLHDSMAEGLRPGTDGWFDDDLAFVADWGFALDDISVPVLVVAGGQDLMVPVAHGTWLARTVPGATAMLDEAAGHLSLLTQSGRVHTWLLDQYER